MHPVNSLPSGVEVIPAMREQQPVLANLLQLYIYDFSEFLDLATGPDGRFDYPWLPLYWQQETRFPFLVKVDGNLAGFVLVSKGSLISGNPEIWDMAEFFIMRKYRRRGIGAAIAHEIWRRFPGAWEVRVLERNVAALPFWETTIKAFAGTGVEAFFDEQGSKQGRVFSFVSAPAVNSGPVDDIQPEEKRGES